MKIGIVGQGYVGTAVKEVFSKHYETNTFDLNGDCTCTDIEDLVDKSDDEEAMLSEAFHVKPNSRLGCQIQVFPELEGLEIELAPEE